MTVSNHGQQEIELSIILLSYNTAILTKKCIESIIKEIGEQMKYEIIVFDNDSTDETVTVIKKLAIKNNNLKYFHNKENLGFAKGNNRAVTHAKGKYLLFLNTDTVVLDNAVARLFKYYKVFKFIHFYLFFQILKIFSFFLNFWNNYEVNVRYFSDKNRHCTNS